MYYSNTQRQPKRRTFAGRIITIIMSVLALFAGVALLLTLIAPVVKGESILFPLLGILAPATYIFSLIVTLMLIIRWQWKIALVMLLLLIAGLGQVSHFIKLSAVKNKAVESTSRDFKLISYNTKMGRAPSQELFDYLEQSDCSIIALQEARSSNEKFKQAFAGYDRSSVSGLTLLTRYKIINEQTLFKGNSEYLGVAQMVDLSLRDDTIRVINVHLRYTSITSADNKFLHSEEVLQVDSSKNKLLDMARRLAKNSVARREQSDIIAKEIEHSPYPIIVCGDFNDTPQSYTYNRISKGLIDAFEQCGSGYSHTFKGFLSMLRIDYVLCSPSIKPIFYEVDESAPFSDHFPVIVELRLSDKKLNLNNI